MAGSTEALTVAAPAMAPVEGADKDFESRALNYRQVAETLTVSDQRTHDRAAEFFLGMKALEKEIVTHHARMKKKAYDSWQEVITTEKLVLVPVQEAIGIIGPRIARWESEQKAIEADNRRRAAEEAQRATEEAARKAATELQEQRRRETEDRLAAAIAFEQNGAEEAIVEAVMAQPAITADEVVSVLSERVQVAPRPVAPAFVPMKGASLRDNWQWEATDETKVPREYLMLDTKKINSIVGTMKNLTNIPGIRAYNVPGMAGRVGRK